MTTDTATRRTPMPWGERLCWTICEYLYKRQGRLITTGVDRAKDCESQVQWRLQDAKRYLDCFERTVSFENKVVLDFACGTGAIAQVISTLTRPKHMIGVDSNPDVIDLGKASFPSLSLTCVPRNKTLLSAESVDIAYTTDAFEHFEQPDEVLEELYRVVKPGGHILIHFIPWWGMEGPHLQGVIPLPWCHVFFSERTLLRTAARIVRSDFYRPLAWDFERDGRRRYDMYDHQDRFDRTYLNHLTIRGFKRYVRPYTAARKLEVASFEVLGFSGSVFPWARSLRWLCHVPWLQEFTNRGIYGALRKVG